MKLEPGQRLRVKEAFYASGVPVMPGWLVNVDWIKAEADPENRRFELTVSLTPVEPAGKTILWGRSSSLEEDYLNRIFENA